MERGARKKWKMLSSIKTTIRNIATKTTTTLNRICLLINAFLPSFLSSSEVSNLSPGELSVRHFIIIDYPCPRHERKHNRDCWNRARTQKQRKAFLTRPSPPAIKTLFEKHHPALSIWVFAVIPNEKFSMLFVWLRSNFPPTNGPLEYVLTVVNCEQNCLCTLCFSAEHRELWKQPPPTPNVRQTQIFNYSQVVTFL